MSAAGRSHHPNGWESATRSPRRGAEPGPLDPDALIASVSELSGHTDRMEGPSAGRARRWIGPMMRLCRRNCDRRAGRPFMNSRTLAFLAAALLAAPVVSNADPAGVGIAPVEPTGPEVNRAFLVRSRSCASATLNLGAIVGVACTQPSSAGIGGLTQASLAASMRAASIKLPILAEVIAASTAQVGLYRTSWLRPAVVTAE